MSARCEAHLPAVRPGPYGLERIRCHQRTALRVFVDAKDREHYYCAALGHLDELIRIYGAPRSEVMAWPA